MAVLSWFYATEDGHMMQRSRLTLKEYIIIISFTEEILSSTLGDESIVVAFKSLPIFILCSTHIYH